MLPNPEQEGKGTGIGHMSCFVEGKICPGKSHPILNCFAAIRFLLVVGVTYIYGCSNNKQESACKIQAKLAPT